MFGSQLLKSLTDSIVGNRDVGASPQVDNFDEEYYTTEDCKAGLKALRKHRKNPKTIDHKTLLKELGLTESDIV